MKKRLLAKRAALVAELVALGKIEEDGGTLTAEQLARFSAIQVEIEGPDGLGAKSTDQNCLDAQIARADTVEARAAQLVAPVGTAQASGTDPGQSNQPPSGPQAATLFVNDAEFFNVIATGKDDQRLAKYRTEQSMQDGTAGGFMVPKEYSTDMKQIEPQPAIIRPRATVLGAGSSPDASLSMPFLNQSTSNAAAPANVYGGVVVGWGAEGAAVGATGFKIKDGEWKPNECTAYIPVTNKLLRNWPGAGGFITKQLLDARNADEDLRFLRGDGIGKPRGIIGSGAAKVVARSNANDFDYDDVVAMSERILEEGGQPIWLINRSVKGKIMKMVDPEGHYIFIESARTGAGPQLDGKPIVWNQRNPTLGSVGDVVLANLPYYLIKDGYGPIVAGSEHVLFLNNKTVFKMGYSVDGQPWLEAPFTDESGYEVSPFVVLGAAA